MQSQATTVNDHLSELPPDRLEVVEQLRRVVLGSLPKGFEETMNYGMIGYVVPHSLYPDGYHCDPTLPLPFAAIASQKNSVNFYHSGIYTDPDIHDWFVREYENRCDHRLDMGKSCIRWTKTKTPPYDLIGELMQKLTVDDWVKMYESRKEMKTG